MCATHMVTPGGGCQAHSPVFTLTYISSCDCGSNISTHSILPLVLHEHTHRHNKSAQIGQCSITMSVSMRQQMLQICTHPWSLPHQS